MTKEELEEEAEEMAVNNAKKIYGLEDSVCMNIQECAYVNGFQDGAEFGFQKGIKARINTTTISDYPIKAKLTKAKELLKWALHSDPEHDDLTDFDTKWKEAEQFLKED